VGELNPSIVDKEVFIWGADINCPAANGLAILRIFNALSSFACQQASHLTFVPGVEMLNYYDGRELSADIAQKFDQGQQTSGRRSDGD